MGTAFSLTPHPSTSAAQYKVSGSTLSSTEQQNKTNKTKPSNVRLLVHTYNPNTQGVEAGWVGGPVSDTQRSYQDPALTWHHVTLKILQALDDNTWGSYPLLFYLCRGFVCEYACTPGASLGHKGTRRGHQITRDWNYRRLCCPVSRYSCRVGAGTTGVHRHTHPVNR